MVVALVTVAGRDVHEAKAKALGPRRSFVAEHLNGAPIELERVDVVGAGEHGGSKVLHGVGC